MFKRIEAKHFQKFLYQFQNEIVKLKSGKMKRKVKCLICSETFVAQYTLNRHIKESHEGVKGYQCLICSQSFGQQGSLNTHVKTVHGNNKPFNCLICNKSFG